MEKQAKRPLGGDKKKIVSLRPAHGKKVTALDDKATKHKQAK